MLRAKVEVSTLNKDLSPLIYDISKITYTNMQSIAANSYYEAPYDGVYCFVLKGSITTDGSALIYSDSARTQILFQENGLASHTIYMKAGTKIYTRAVYSYYLAWYQRT